MKPCLFQTIHNSKSNLLGFYYIPYTVTIYANCTLWQDQTVYSLKTVICDRIGIEPDMSCIMLCGGEVLQEQKILGDYPAVTDGARIVLRKNLLFMHLQDQNAKFITFMPQVKIQLKLSVNV